MKRKMIVGAVLLSLGMVLGGCAYFYNFYTLREAADLADATRPVNDGAVEGAQEETEGDSEESESVFGAVPYFHDDTGRDAQEVDGYLYGFWGGRFCRYDTDTWEETLLYEAPCNQAGNFFIQGEDIYFLTRHGANSLDRADICLYRMKLDGSDCTLLCDNIPDMDGRLWDNYEIDMYQDIFYLTSYYNMPDVFYRLDGDEIVAVEETETVYGTIPEGYEALEDSLYNNMPSVAYMMRHYGYLFVADQETRDLYRYDPEEGTIELFLKSDILGDGRRIANGTLFLTNGALYFCDDALYNDNIEQWYCLSLEGQAEPEMWIQTSVEGMTTRLEIFWDEEGAWLIDTLDNERRVFWAAWEDTQAQAGRKIWSNYLDTVSVFSDQWGLLFRDQDAFYYNRRTAKGDAIVRLADDQIAEEVIAIFDTSQVRNTQLFDKKVETYEIYSRPDVDSYNFSFQNELLCLTENTEGARQINAYLERLYQERKKVEPTDVWEEDMLEDLPEDVTLGSYWELTMDVVYLDEDYLCVEVMDGGFHAMGTHPNYVMDYYVFDRVTGERLSITDLVEESEEEICDIIAPYVELENLSFDEWTPRESILEADRLFLSESGIGIHYDTYEMSDYASGTHDFIIPFEEFSMRLLSHS